MQCVSKDPPMSASPPGRDTPNRIDFETHSSVLLTVQHQHYHGALFTRGEEEKEKCEKGRLKIWGKRRWWRPGGGKEGDSRILLQHLDQRILVFRNRACRNQTTISHKILSKQARLLLRVPPVQVHLDGHPHRQPRPVRSRHQRCV